MKPTQRARAPSIKAKAKAAAGTKPKAKAVAGIKAKVKAVAGTKAMAKAVAGTKTMAKAAAGAGTDALLDTAAAIMVSGACNSPSGGSENAPAPALAPAPPTDSPPPAAATKPAAAASKPPPPKQKPSKAATAAKVKKPTKAKADGSNAGKKPWQRKVPWKSYDDACAFVHKLNFAGVADWKAWCKIKGNRPPSIPSNPNIVYEGSGWVNFKQFVGTAAATEAPTAKQQQPPVRQPPGTATVKKEPRPKKEPWKTYQDAAAFVQALKVEGVAGWKLYCRSGKRPRSVPSNPNIVYNGKGWTTWKAFLGKSPKAPAQEGGVPLPGAAKEPATSTSTSVTRDGEAAEDDEAAPPPPTSSSPAEDIAVAGQEQMHPSKQWRQRAGETFE